MSQPSPVARFGFAAEPYEAAFCGVNVRPLVHYDARRKWYEAASNSDGFFYPPTAATYELRQDGSRKRRIPRTTRPAQSFRILPSHELSIESPLEPAFPFSDATFIVQLIAFTFGTRMQFESWRVDGRVPFKSLLGTHMTDMHRSAFLEHAYTRWKQHTAPHRTRLINLFYAYNRATSAEWEWDAFNQQYMIFDAIFRFHSERFSLKGQITHKERFSVLCSAYKIPLDAGIVEKLYVARNELFHESMWVGSMIGYATADRDAYQFPRHLARLNARLLCAICDWRNAFTASVWWAMGSFLFDMKRSEA